MRLYSRNQVLAVVAVAAVAALAIGAAVSVLVVTRGLLRAARRSLPHPLQPRADRVRVPVRRCDDQPPADEQNNIEVYDRVNRSVVYITTITLEYSYFFEAMPQEGTGSGVIIDTEGHVLTNYHVVKGADQLRITLSDGTELEGKVTGTDPENDLAVVKFDPKDISSC
jgi:S1-C subfamily serine protease